MQVYIENRSSSSAVVRVRLQTPAVVADCEGAAFARRSAVALLVRPVTVRAAAAEHETAFRKLQETRMEQHKLITAQTQEMMHRHLQQQQVQQPQPGYVAAIHSTERLRAQSAMREQVMLAQRRIDDIEAQMIAAVCEAFQLDRNDRRRLPLGWMLFRPNVLLDCAMRRLALAKLGHPRLGTAAPFADLDCGRRIAEFFAAVERSLHSDLDTGSFVAWDADRACALVSGVEKDGFLTPVCGQEAAVLLSGLKSNTCFEVSGFAYACFTTPSSSFLWADAACD